MPRRALIAGFAMVAVATALMIALQPPGLPSFEEVRAEWRPSDAQLLDRHGDPLYERRIDSHGRRLAWTPLNEVSPAIVRAVIASEDRRFFEHHGVDLRALTAATLDAVRGRHTRGASTITMQVVGMLDPSLGRAGSRRTVRQKLAQMKAALALEHRWSKDQILEAYLNLVTWRGELEGVNAATRVMFARAPHGVTTGEAVVMAALLRAPNAHRDSVARRADRLGIALGADSPTSSDITAAMGDVYASPRPRFERVTLAPHVAERLLTGDAATVRCTLDADLQRFATETLKRHVLEVRERGVDDGAVLVVDNATGEVWAYVGSAGDVSGAPWVDGVRAMRQPGSALKPFLYALAADRRILTAASLVEDTPLELPEERGLYRPSDYDHRFRGLVSMRTALASSLNLPAVRAAELVGVDSFTEKLRELGFTSVVEAGDFYGAALALGSADVTLWDITAAYRTLANAGAASPLTLTSGGGAAPGRRIYSADAAFVISDILADRSSRSETFGLENSLATRYWSAVKTGTSKDMRDNWCVGYTNRFTVGVWVGNVTGAPMRDVTGVTGAAPVWLDVMNYLHERFSSGAIKPPPGVVRHAIDFPNAVEAPRVDWFLAGTEPRGNEERIDRGAPRITSPADNSIIAIDPDIPRSKQRVSFEASHAGAGARWILDGREIGPAASPCMWEPQPGPHMLGLMSAGGHLDQKVEFSVRGSASTEMVERDDDRGELEEAPDER
jgi:penicillin-binding protein 1C